MENDPYVVTAQILAYDDKRIHQFQRMFHASDHHLVATCEWMNLHVSLDTRRVTPWPDDILAQIAAASAAQAGQSWPREAGKQMHVRNPVYSLNPEA